MREIIELIHKHQKICRILQSESPYFHHCWAHINIQHHQKTNPTIALYRLFQSLMCVRLQQQAICINLHKVQVFVRWRQLCVLAVGCTPFMRAAFQVVLGMQVTWRWKQIVHHYKPNVLATTLQSHSKQDVLSHSTSVLCFWMFCLWQIWESIKNF